MRRKALRALLALVIVPITVVAAGATPAFAGCPPDSGNGAVPGSATHIGLQTSAYSYWLTGPGSISYTTTQTASSSYTVSGQYSYTVSDIFSSASVQFGVSLEKSNSTTTGWTYSLKVPSGVKARGQVWHEALKFKYGHYTINGACQTLWSNEDTVIAPYTSTNNSFYEIKLMDYPGTNTTAW